MKDFICNNCEFYSPSKSGFDVEKPYACKARILKQEKVKYMKLNKCPIWVKRNNKELLK